jgi:hypothetical protein
VRVDRWYNDDFFLFVSSDVSEQSFLFLLNMRVLSFFLYAFEIIKKQQSYKLSNIFIFYLIEILRYNRLIVFLSFLDDLFQIIVGLFMNVRVEKLCLFNMVYDRY